MPASDPRDSIAAAAAQPQPAPDLRDPEEPGGGDSFDADPLGGDCPVQPLGFLKKTYYFLDWTGQLIDLSTRCEKGELMGLFGIHMNWLDHRFPGPWREGKKGEPPWRDGFDQKKAQRALILACAQQGLFNPTGKVRGRGAHRGDDGRLVLHCGDRLIVSATQIGMRLGKPSSHKPGLMAGYVYDTADRLGPPADKPAPVATVQQLALLIDTWNWKEKAAVPLDADAPEIGTVSLSAYIMLCWKAAAMLGGALKNRPHLWFTGPSGAGKTTLQQLFRDVLGDWGVFTEDATEAGVRQTLDKDTLAVLFDEIEPDENNADIHMKIVKLARLAYSGGGGLRGGQDHNAKQFVARSCYLFSSIHHHELPQQDRNRMAVLHLSKFPPKTAPLVVPPEVKEWGNAIRRRLVDQWHRYDATLQVYQRAMLAQGYAGREQDTYGTLLACGDLLFYDSAPNPDAMHEVDRAAQLVKALARLIDHARAEAEDTTERCLKWLASYRLPAKSGQDAEPVGEWLTRYAVEIAMQSGETGPRDKLKSHGLRIFGLKPDHRAGNGQGGTCDPMGLKGAYLAVANKTNRGVLEIYHGSTWAKGVWTQALGLVTGAESNKKVRFAGPPEGCVMVPLDSVIDLDEVLARVERIRRDRGERLPLD